MEKNFFKMTHFSRKISKDISQTMNVLEFYGKYFIQKKKHKFIYFFGTLGNGTSKQFLNSG